MIIDILPGFHFLIESADLIMPNGWDQTRHIAPNIWRRRLWLSLRPAPVIVKRLVHDDGFICLFITTDDAALLFVAQLINIFNVSRSIIIRIDNGLC